MFYSYADSNLNIHLSYNTEPTCCRLQSVPVVGVILRTSLQSVSERTAQRWAAVPVAVWISINSSSAVFGALMWVTWKDRIHFKRLSGLCPSGGFGSVEPLTESEGGNLDAYKRAYKQNWFGISCKIQDWTGNTKLYH